MKLKNQARNIIPLVILLAVTCSIAPRLALTQDGGLISNVENSSPFAANTWGSSDPTGDEWPMEGGRLSRTGTTTTTPVSGAAALWKSTVIGLKGSPVISGGYVYLSAPESSNIYVYCLSATTGNQVWQSDIYNYDYFTSPTVAGGSIFVGVNGVDDADGWVHCIDSTDGTTNWSQHAGDTVDYSPVVAGGLVYFGSRTWNSGQSLYVANLTCLDATTGSTQWSVAVNNSQFTAPAIVGTRIYVGCGGNMSCYDASNGHSYWNYTVPGQDLTTTAAVAGGYVYFGTDNMIYCVDINGVFQWGHSTGDLVSSVAVEGGRVYAGSRDYIIYCLDTTNNGQQIWAYTTGGQIESSPVIANGLVYVKNFGDYSKVYCLNAATGSLNWSYDCHTTGGYSNDPSPCIANGYIYQGINGQVCCLPMIIPSTTTNPPPGNDIAGPEIFSVVGIIALTIVGIWTRARRKLNLP